MYSNLQLLKKYVRHYRHASNGKGHGVHSPFVYDFIRNVVNDGQGYAAPSEVEALRQELRRDGRMLDMRELGAGSRGGSAPKKAVRSIARTALKPPRLAKLLYRLARHYQPDTILELGTSLGLTTAYFSKACPDARILTLEGNPSVAAIARENFQKLHCSNIQLLEGNFDDLLPTINPQLPTLSLSYIDGNHRYAPTLDYFHQLLARTDENSILVFDDIHWSAEMEKAWSEICGHASVRYSIDLFYLGLVFFRRSFAVKQDFAIRFR